MASFREVTTKHPLTLAVELGEDGAGHTNYLVRLKAITLSQEWTVEYRFGKFRELHNTLCSELALSKEFPTVGDMQRYMGVPLTTKQLEIRAELLTAWLVEVVSKRHTFGKSNQELITMFFQLSTVGDYQSHLVVSQLPPTKVARASAPGRKAGDDVDDWATVVRTMLHLGLPVLQFKKRKSKFGMFTTRPRILRLSSSCVQLQLVAPVEGQEWDNSNVVSISSVTQVLAGIHSQAVEKSVARQDEEAVRAGLHNFSIISADQQWDLQVSRLWADGEHVQATGGDSAAGAGASPNLSVRDRIVAVLNSLIVQTRGNDSFFASPSFEGEKTGFVFKKGDMGLGYYRDP